MNTSRKRELTIVGILLLGFLMALTTVSFGAMGKEPIDYVNPFIGVGLGHTYPGVGVPFGFTVWTPQSARATGSKDLPYSGDKLITGFRGTHYPSGACMSDYGSITIEPQAGQLKVTLYDRQLSMSNISAHPDYFACALTGHDGLSVKVELTATLHCGFFPVGFLGGFRFCLLLLCVPCFCGYDPIPVPFPVFLQIV